MPNNFFVISIEYTKPMSEVELHLAAHQSFLNEAYSKGIFLISGRKVPRTGGVIIATAESRSVLDALIECDPFKMHNIADYNVIEFIPSKYHESIAGLIEKLT